MDRSITFMPINPQKTWDYWALKLIKVNMLKGGLAPRDGFEPPAKRLTVACSTAELPGTNTALLRQLYIITYKVQSPFLLGCNFKRSGRFAYSTHDFVDCFFPLFI